MSFPLSITNTPRQFKPTYNLTLYPDKNIFAWQSHDNISVAVVMDNLLWIIVYGIQWILSELKPFN
ncbi:hypothetical protein [Providencia sp. wls1914]|uniref:hypothetical protein n=1 Tax=Providencia sp. wls1914 TaxID=2675156 RepID=UPI0012B5210A|nr:hypothetical protein [Providencia sp. wls1914]MTC70788.1 hypothetical protein [Providencia sp. wls1914]MTC76458.1 hypothetical protein [Providencia sp. wls1919]